MSFQCETHHLCIDDALQAAEEICSQREIRLTKQRKRILELVWREHKPVKAYDLLSQFQQEDPAAKPATIYRSLDFLQENGLIHKIHRLNAYIGCVHPNHGEPYFILICTQCNTVFEHGCQSYTNLIKEIETEQHFQCTNTIVEIEGLCKACH